MATINDAAIILSMLANRGVYIAEDGEADPAANYIYKYHSPLARKEVYSVMYRNTPLLASEYVHNPVMLMDHGELTPDGQAMLDAALAEKSVK
jgi:hypothetical protein